MHTVHLPLAQINETPKVSLCFVTVQLLVFEMCLWVELRTNLGGLVVLEWQVVSQTVVSWNVGNQDAKQIETVRK